MPSRRNREDRSVFLRGLSGGMQTVRFATFFLRYLSCGKKRIQKTRGRICARPAKAFADARRELAALGHMPLCCPLHASGDPGLRFHAGDCGQSPPDFIDRQGATPAHEKRCFSQKFLRCFTKTAVFSNENLWAGKAVISGCLHPRLCSGLKRQSLYFPLPLFFVRLRIAQPVF